MQNKQILSTQPLELETAPARPRPRAPVQRALVFDACHVGVVLRAVLFVEIVLGVGAMYGASTLLEWLARVSLLTGGALQLNNPSLLAEHTAIAVVADFRSRDVAAGGQGAPLVPAFHQGVFGRAGETVLVLNIGGISNLSVLGADGSVQGFDCGPGNALMDHWCQLHTGQAYDCGGAWAAQGQVLPNLLATLMQEPFLHQPPPKSTGRDLFNPAWLAAALAGFPMARPVDVQATLTELTASACAESARSYEKYSKILAVCGGGALNTHLMQRLQALLPGVSVVPTDDLGLPAMQVEAAAFAWLARQTLLGQTGNLQSVTGAKGARVLGAVYPA